MPMKPIDRKGKPVSHSHTPPNPVAARPHDASAHGPAQQPGIRNDVEFPLCDAAVAKMKDSGWELADAIVEECSETGDDGVRNGSHAKMEAMHEEIDKNHGVTLSLERIRKLRQVASAFPRSRRRPAVSIEGHLEAGSPDALDAFIKSAPTGTALTRNYIRRLTHPDENTEQDQRKAERQRQKEEQRTAWQNVCKKLERERDDREQRYNALCSSIGKKPESFSPPLAPEGEPSLTVSEDLERSVRGLLMARGIDPAADNIKQALADFVKAVLAQQK
jgi:hypothetical protein